jgi:Ca-activated chloride channel family protein
MRIRRASTISERLSCAAALAAVCVFATIPCLSGSSRRNLQIPAAGSPIRVAVSLVTVPVVATDRDGKYITGLRLEDFHIFENGVQQKVDRLIPASDPFHVALMLDSSGSTHFKFADIQIAAQAFVDSLRPQDRIMVVSFDAEMRVHTGLTDDRARLRRAILETQSSSEGTRLYDALDRVLEAHLEALPGRKAIVLFSDGVDNGSMTGDSGSTRSKIEKSDVVLYAIQYDTRKDGIPDRFSVPLPQGYESFNTLYSRAVKYFGNLTNRSGGRLFHAETIAGLNEAFSQIASELPLQYTLCYYPVKPAKDGSFRKIRVTVDRPGVKVRARAGYRAGTKPPERRPSGSG